MLIFFQPFSTTSPLPKQHPPKPKALLSAQFSACAASQLRSWPPRCSLLAASVLKTQGAQGPRAHIESSPWPSLRYFWGFRYGALGPSLSHRWLLLLLPPQVWMGTGDLRPSLPLSAVSHPAGVPALGNEPVSEPAIDSTASCGPWRKELLGPTQQRSRFGAHSNIQLDARGHIIEKVCCQK